MNSKASLPIKTFILPNSLKEFIKLMRFREGNAKKTSHSIKSESCELFQGVSGKKVKICKKSELGLRRDGSLVSNIKSNNSSIDAKEGNKRKTSYSIDNQLREQVKIISLGDELLNKSSGVKSSTNFKIKPAYFLRKKLSKAKNPLEDWTVEESYKTFTPGLKIIKKTVQRKVVLKKENKSTKILPFSQSSIVLKIPCAKLVNC